MKKILNKILISSTAILFFCIAVYAETDTLSVAFREVARSEMVNAVSSLDITNISKYDDNTWINDVFVGRGLNDKLPCINFCR